jgi:hypothetical protein
MPRNRRSLPYLVSRLCLSATAGTRGPNNFGRVAHGASGLGVQEVTTPQLPQTVATLIMTRAYRPESAPTTWDIKSLMTQDGT